MDREPDVNAPADGGPTEKNISTEHQPQGAARNPSDTLKGEDDNEEGWGRQ